MSYPDYKRYEQFYSYLASIDRAMSERQEQTVRAKTCVTAAKDVQFADLYAALPEDVKTYYDTIEGL